MRTLIGALAVLFVSGCADAPVGVRAIEVTRPVFSFDATRPIPVLHSATFIAGGDPGFPIVRVSFFDAAEDESITSAYFTPDGGFSGAQTFNIAGQPGTGERTVDLVIEDGYTTLRLRHMWGTLPTTDDPVFGPFSDAVTIGSEVIVTAKPKKKH